ncbi:MAG: UTP--glucose-1-phosphate uridylyltransferase GalU [Nitrospinae bacterium]|nr:UTP--glucose-1-phosphate uridylyltransferase GalU [Nitrospinota bacterium]
MIIRKAVFPVAGMGTRFLPATKASPKEMLALVDKPLIQYVVEEAIEAGIKEFIMITGRNKYAIEDHFDRSVELELLLEQKGDKHLLEIARNISDMCDFFYIRQKEPKGLGHAILRVKDLVDGEAFAVLLGDDLIYSEGKPAIAQLKDVHMKTNAPVVAVERVDPDSVSSYGIVEPVEVGPGLYRIKSMVEKPARDKAPSNLAIIGRYILTPDIFPHIEALEADHKGEIQLTAALNSLLSEREIYACEFSGKRYDAGDKLGFLKATVEYALRREDLGAKFREYLKTLSL